MKAGFHPKSIHVGILSDKLAIGQVFTREIRKTLYMLLNVHKNKTYAVKFNKFRSDL